MYQATNLIRVDEGGVSVPLIVHERLSQFAQVQLREGLKLIREQRGSESFFLICEPIKDATFEDIELPSDVKQEPSNTYNQTVTDNNGNTNKTEEVTV